MKDKIILLEQSETLAGNPSRIEYYVAPETRVDLEDGSTLIARAQCNGSFTPEGKPVKGKYRSDTLSSNGGWTDMVEGRPYRGLVIIKMGPDIETEIRPPWKPYNPDNKGSDYC